MVGYRENKKPHNQDDSHEQTVDNGNSIYEELETNLFPESVHLSFKNECGEYPTATSYAVWKAVNESANCTTSTHILIYNHHHSINHSLILIRKAYDNRLPPSLLALAPVFSRLCLL